MYLHSDGGFLRTTCTPQNQSKGREKHQEADNKSKTVKTTAEEMLVSILIVQKAFFFNGIKLILPWLPTLPLRVVVVVLAWTRLEGTREASGGGLTGVRAKRRVGVRVRRRAHSTEHWARVERVCGLFSIVRVPRWALHVVHRSPRRPCWWGLAQATHLRVCLHQHWHCCCCCCWWLRWYGGGANEY